MLPGTHFLICSVLHFGTHFQQKKFEQRNFTYQRVCDTWTFHKQTESSSSPLLRQCIAILRSPKGGCCSISDDLSCYYTCLHPVALLHCIYILTIMWKYCALVKNHYFAPIANWIGCTVLSCYDDTFWNVLYRKSIFFFYFCTFRIDICWYRYIIIYIFYHLCFCWNSHAIPGDNYFSLLFYLDE